MDTKCSAWKPTPISKLPSWKGAKRVALDTETCDPDLKELGPGSRRNGYMVGYSFAIEDGPAYYVPFRHEGGDNVDEDQALAYLRAQLRDYSRDIIGANLSYDLDYLHSEGMVYHPSVTFRDVQIADPLINELHMSYSLQNIAGRWGFEGKDQTVLEQAAAEYGVDPKAGLWRLPARYVGQYATVDATLPLEVYALQREEIDKQNLWRIFNLESRIMYVLMKMRWKGVLIDQYQLERVAAWSLEEETKQLNEVHRQTGIRVEVGDVWKAKCLVPVVESLGVKIPLTAKTKKPSLTKDFLASLDHPVANMLNQARKVNKLRTTFAASIMRHMTDDGRIHCVFNQLRRTKEDGNPAGAAYGRLSSEHPNLQQQPSRDDFAPFWRSIYIPENGAMWACADFSQQEPRILTHYAYITGKEGAKTMRDAYVNDPSTDNHDMMAKLTGLKRTHAKQMFLALIYGMGGGKLAADLGLPTETRTFRRRTNDLVYEYLGAGPEAQEIIDTFNNKAPYVKELSNMVKGKAIATGQIVTLLGRHCRFPKTARGYDWIHKALNRLIQGSAADQTKQAMLDVFDAGYEMQLQVHDELDWSAESVQEARDVAQIMMDAVKLEVPTKVDIELGRNWGDCKEIAKMTPEELTFFENW